MRILYVVRGLNQSSGTTHVIVPLAEEMARRGHDVWLYAVRKPAGTAELLPDSTLVHTRIFEMSLPMNHPGFSMGFARKISREIHGFDIIHIQAVRNFVTWWTMRCGRNAGVPYIVAPQGSYDPWVLGQRSLVNRLWDRRMELSLLNHAARIQCLSVREVEQVKAVGIVAPVTILPNGVGDATRASEREKEDARNTLGITRDASVILFLGRLHPKKGLDVLIRAFAQLQVPAMHPLLLIAGSDAGSGYAQAMKMLASETGIGDRIRFLGEVKGYEKSLALAAADVFALPSHSEGLPVALLEAMSAGLPVVITDACNLPEVEKSGAGIVIADGGDALQPLLAEAMRRLAGDAKLRQTMGMRAKALVANRFSWKRLADDLTDLYEAVLRTSR